jgi:DNA-binding MarR family transcriptional regulator
MGLFGLASGRHIDHVIARLCAVGLMQLEPSEQDRRVRILKPTEALRARS